MNMRLTENRKTRNQKTGNRTRKQKKGKDKVGTRFQEAGALAAPEGACQRIDNLQHNMLRGVVISGRVL